MAEKKKETTRVKMLKTVANASTVWFAENEKEGRDGLYDVDPEVAKAWIRDGVAEAVGAGGAAAEKEIAAAEKEGDADKFPRASEVDPDLQGQAQPVNPAQPAKTAAKKAK